ncbi:hypothetical protein E3E31_08225 [Thermococcus sp. M39]|uniref:hypothetical protein n=1 Tax=unclassified Thermococcus TaxID=2627626 RepID=UPI00143B052D|nr:MULTISPECIES: hypothetical protein [unclassified Thermococcus]NJE08507.1 hypothetical protein [Thermococcus sp. M39]NJE13842.1 hypothetical protein [Thermococcus sp. LS2]
MEKGESKVVRLTDDAYKALGRLRGKIRRYGESYSYSDIVLAAALLLDNAIERHIANVRDLATIAKVLRLQKLRGELPRDFDIFEELKKRFPNSIEYFTTPPSEIVSSIIEQLVDDGYPDAAASILFAHKEELSPEKFAQLSAKILEAQVQMKKQVKEQPRE